MAPVAVVVSYCSAVDNTALHFFQASVAATPTALWIALSGFALVTHEWYFWMYSHSWLAVYVLQALVGQLLGWLRDAPDPTCNNTSWVGPHTGTALMLAFCTQAVINSVALRIPIGRMVFFTKVALIVAVAVTPVVNSNATWGQVAAGAGIGVLVGVCAMWLLWQVWMPLLPALEQVAWLRHWAKLHACRDLRRLYYRDMVCESAGPDAWGEDPPVEMVGSARAGGETPPLRRRGSAHGVTGHPWGHTLFGV